MFQIIIDDAIKIHDNLISVAGKCKNKNEFSKGFLTDEHGNVYDAHVPFLKTLVHDDSRALLGIIGAIDANAMIGRTLTSVVGDS